MLYWFMRVPSLHLLTNIEYLNENKQNKYCRYVLGGMSSTVPLSTCAIESQSENDATIL